MRNLFTIFAVLLTISSCQTNSKKIIEGDLYFKLVDLQRFFDAPDSLLTKIETSIKTINTDTLTEQDKKFYVFLEFMSDKKLLRKPFIRLRQDNGDIIMVFLNTNAYNRLKDFNHDDLVRSNNKIRVKAEVLELKDDSLSVYKASKIISIDKIKGKTYWKK